jgi:hypothetical protein
VADRPEPARTAPHCGAHATAGDRARRPLLGVVVTQDPRFDIRRCHHGRAPSGRVVVGPEDDHGGGEIPDGRGPGTAFRTNRSARPVAETAYSRFSRRSRPSASRTADNHPKAIGVNPDASLFLAAPGSGLPGRHARAVPDGWPGNAHRRLVGDAAGRDRGSLRRSRSGRGRNSYRSGPGCGIPRR